MVRDQSEIEDIVQDSFIKAIVQLIIFVVIVLFIPGFIE